MPLPRNQVLLIELLRRSWPVGRTVGALAHELNLQTWRVSDLIGRLDELAVPIEHTGQAVRLDPTRSPLLGELIELELNTQQAGRSVLLFPQTGSTNDVAWQAARRRDSHGLVALAESQTAGRGRLGRSWCDCPGDSLLFSLLLLDVPMAEGLANRLMMLTCVAIAEAIQEAVGLAVAARWPNDLYVHGCKLAGILLESRGASSPAGKRVSDTVSRAGGERLDVVLGAGINCNQSPEDFPDELQATATSLAAELGHRVDRTALIRTILRRLDCWLCGTAVLGSHPEAPGDEITLDRLHGEYLRWMDHQARRVRVHHNAETVEATVRDVDPVNGLIVELPAGGITHFAPAAVSVDWLDR